MDEINEAPRSVYDLFDLFDSFELFDLFKIPAKRVDLKGSWGPSKYFYDKEKRNFLLLPIMYSQRKVWFSYPLFYVVKRLTSFQQVRYMMPKRSLPTLFKDAGLRTFGIDPIGLDVDIILSQV